MTRFAILRAFMSSSSMQWEYSLLPANWTVMGDGTSTGWLDELNSRAADGWQALSEVTIDEIDDGKATPRRFLLLRKSRP